MEDFKAAEYWGPQEALSLSSPEMKTAQSFMLSEYNHPTLSPVTATEPEKASGMCWANKHTFCPPSAQTPQHDESCPFQEFIHDHKEGESKSTSENTSSEMDRDDYRGLGISPQPIANEPDRNTFCPSLSAAEVTQYKSGGFFVANRPITVFEELEMLREEIRDLHWQ
ncbi:hypothetical protein N7454_007364 [Penicillium verhagenii]|nr:hypothetical protein N7454_007364 [Penicillium verhagenii]